MVNKATKMTKITRRTVQFLDTHTFLPLYKTMVRSHLDYAVAVAVRYPYKIKHKIEIENVQRRATKELPGMRELSYTERLKLLRLPTLAYRRLRGDMIEVYKIMMKCTIMNPHQKKKIWNHLDPAIRIVIGYHKVLDILPLTINDRPIEQVKSTRLLGVTLTVLELNPTTSLKFTQHWSDQWLGTLARCGTSLTKQQTKQLEFIQRRAMSIIFRNMSYAEAIVTAGITTLADRRESQHWRTGGNPNTGRPEGITTLADRRETLCRTIFANIQKHNHNQRFLYQGWYNMVGLV